MISINKEALIEVNQSSIKTSEPVLCSGAVVALKVNLDVDAKIAAISNSTNPAVILYYGDAKKNYIKVAFFDYAGFEVFACEVYNRQLNVCLINNI